MRLPISISLPLSLLLLSQVQPTRSECPSTCPSGSTCYNGNRLFNQITLSTGEKLPSSVAMMLTDTCPSDSNSYCDCDEKSIQAGHYGFTGCTCQTKINICQNGLVCLNGAPCVDVTNNYKNSKGKKEFTCGCPYANTGGNDVWVGKHCEFKRTNVCDKDSGYDVVDGKWFCTDHGTCDDDAVNPDDKCKCETGFHGLHCELTEEPHCSLPCLNNGVCNYGVKDVDEDYDYYFDDDMPSDDEDDEVNPDPYKPRPKNYLDDDDDNTDDYQYDNDDGDDNEDDDGGFTPRSKVQTDDHCVCPYPYTGEQCGKVITEVNPKDRDANACKCQNGAQCKFDTTAGKYYCDCTTIPDEENKVFAGSKCEFEHSVLCPYPTGEDPFDYFCVNGGKCPQEYHQACTCPSGFWGPRCEFNSKSKDVIKCPINCENGGQCYFGPSPDVPFAELDFQKEENAVAHCKCPEGYTGFLCEIEINVCGEGRHVCANGGMCVKDGNDWECNCLNAIKDGTRYDGPKCEHDATSTCNGSAGEMDWYCTNEGTCKPYKYDTETSNEAKCDCPVGYTGDHCEEEEINECGDGDHMCMNGGVCVKDDLDWLCNCTTATKDNKKNAGDFCNIPSTSICEGGYATGRKGKKREWFCTNGAVCKEEYGLTANDREGSSPGCNCKPGYSGEFCEYLSEKVCGKGEHRCLNGGSCVKDGEDWACDCSKALMGERPARGEKCENPATSYCVGEGGFLEGFCTNWGTCKDAFESDGKSHPGCICKDGFLGDFCEFLEVERTNGVARKAFLGFTICAIGLAAIYMMWKFCKSQDKIERVPTGIPDYDPNYDFEVEHDNSLDMADADNDTRVYGMDSKDIAYG